MSSDLGTLPFQAALGADAARLAPKVRDHFLRPPGVWRYRGVMSRVWRAPGLRGAIARPFLMIGRLTNTLFAETGTDVPFELENAVRVERDGRVSMTWRRTFRFPGRTRRFDGVMVYDRRRGVIVDWLGWTRHLEVDLAARVDDGAIAITSGRQWIRVGPLRIPVPGLLAGRAEVREWQRDDGRLAIRVTITNPILGAFAGYEGSFTDCRGAARPCASR